jgi:hypothetical protein
VYTKNGPTRKGTALKEGAEKGYFARVDRKGRIDESLELRLSQIEDRALEHLRLLRNQTFVLTHRERESISHYMGALFSRTTSRRKGSSKVWRDLIEAYEHALEDPKWVAEHASHCAQHMRRQSLLQNFYTGQKEHSNGLKIQKRQTMVSSKQ